MPAVLEKSITEEQMIEFEQALLAQTVIPAIGNPCLKRTMNFGPKKFVGKVPNALIHQHSNKRVNCTNFDTFSMMPTTAASQKITRPSSKVCPTQKSGDGSRKRMATMKYRDSSNYSPSPVPAESRKV